MALRDRVSGDVLTFRACATSLRDGHLAIVEQTTAGTWIAHMSGACPVHKTNDCVETYLLGKRVASWSLRDFWSWRRNQRAGGAL
ncbi:hypothetical protein MED01_002347 [Micromonospora sp. MED01]|uniref:hypothetical protein n=1 Tax=Micromonospora alfalfae TaxID=2911212 RepID=UPI001EE8F52B|nr:hypothetical protein [Micromonospora alfalfae]MCG5464182.1 hypothetical protein [Micromonospora alfalfae]